MDERTSKPLTPVSAALALTVFGRIRARYARPRAGYWPPVRLFYLRSVPAGEGPERIRDVYHIVERSGPWPRALTVHINASASRFVERIVARAGRVVERAASPVTGTSELVYVIGPRSAGGTAGTRAASRLEDGPRRAAELRAVYRTPEKLTEEAEGYSMPEPSIYDSGAGARAAQMTARPAADGYPELAYVPPDLARAGGRAAAGASGEPPTFAAAGVDRTAYPAARFVGEESATSGGADGSSGLDYREVTANLDFTARLRPTWISII
jgi:hypothetical protein